MSIDEFMLRAEEEDFAIMEEHRSRVDEVVSDPAVAEVLKPYYRYLCKRPCFHDEYLPIFNRPNVTLVDCPAGIERVTEKGLICNGQEFEFDLLVYATGWEAEVTPFPRRAGHDIIGRGGVHMADKWAPGVATLHGMMTSGFPNMFIMPAPGQQAVITANITLINTEGAAHIGATVKLLEECGVRIFDVKQEAEDEYVEAIVSHYVDASSVMAACTPSRLNFEGDPSAMNPRSGAYGGGRGDFLGFVDMLAKWRAEGDFAGLDIELDLSASEGAATK
jgi:cation diffusion facilitator CzcD-associated flavoprotein CzcO